MKGHDHRVKKRNRYRKGLHLHDADPVWRKAKKSDRKHNDPAPQNTELRDKLLKAWQDVNPIH